MRLGGAEQKHETRPGQRKNAFTTTSKQQVRASPGVDIALVEVIYVRYVLGCVPLVAELHGDDARVTTMTSEAAITSGAEASLT